MCTEMSARPLDERHYCATTTTTTLFVVLERSRTDPKEGKEKKIEPWKYASDEMNICEGVYRRRGGIARFRVAQSGETVERF